MRRHPYSASSGRFGRAERLERLEERGGEPLSEQPERFGDDDDEIWIELQDSIVRVRRVSATARLGQIAQRIRVRRRHERAVGREPEIAQNRCAQVADPTGRRGMDGGQVVIVQTRRRLPAAPCDRDKRGRRGAGPSAQEAIPEIRTRRHA